MIKNKYNRIPKHIGIIPDGNRRWAKLNNYDKHEGYKYGVKAGYELYEQMIELGIEEATFYGFTKNNTQRSKIQIDAFVKSCVDAVETLANKDANLLVIGNTNSTVFPKELLKYAGKRVQFGKGLININFLVNYDWKWDLNQAFIRKTEDYNSNKDFLQNIASADISRMDMVIRWGGRRRLSGFLPIQSVYSDIYVIEDYWPNFKTEHLLEAIEWYQTTDVTLGG